MVSGGSILSFVCKPGENTGNGVCKSCQIGVRDCVRECVRGGGGQMCQIGVHFYHIIGVSFQRWLLESVSTHNIDMVVTDLLRHE